MAMLLCRFLCLKGGIIKMNSYERKRRICKMIVLVLGILSINNIILTIRNYSYAYFEKNVKTGVKLKITTLDEMPSSICNSKFK